MGNTGAQICVNCFGRANHDKDEAIVAIGPASPNVLSLTAEDQQLLSHLSTSFSQFISALSIPAATDTSLELIISKDHCEVYGKDTERGFLLRSEWLIPVEAERFIRCLGDIENRGKWDKNVETQKCVKMLTPDAGLFYQTYKKVFMMAQRDLLIVSRAFRQGDSWIDISSSVDLAEFPESKDIVRMKLYLGGYMAEPLAIPVDNFITKVTCVSECDFGGSVPKAIVKKISAITIPSFVKDVVAAANQYH